MIISYAIYGCTDIKLAISTKIVLNFCSTYADKPVGGHLQNFVFTFANLLYYPGFLPIIRKVIAMSRKRVPAGAFFSFPPNSWPFICILFQLNICLTVNMAPVINCLRWTEAVKRIKPGALFIVCLRVIKSCCDF